MIALDRLKRWLAVALGFVALIVGLAVLRQVGDAVLRAATGADPASVFNEVPPPPLELLDVIEWLPDASRDGRPMEPATRDMITDAYVRALAALDRAGRGDRAAPLREYLGGTALEDALEHQRYIRSRRVTTVHLRHDLLLEFYSDDGAIVAVSAPSVEIARIVDGDGVDGSSVHWSGEAWRFIMVLEDGNWRVHQLEIVAVDLPGGRDRTLALIDPLDGVNTVTVNGVDPTWASYDAALGAAELDAALDLGVDSLRVFIAGPEQGQVDIDALARFLDLAAERSVSVVPVLFDGSADHSVSTWRDDRDYIERVVGELAGHEAIVMWDLKNEPDLDDDRSGGSAIVDAWIDRTATLVRSADPATPVTVGWSTARQASRVLDPVDVVSFHHFGDADELEAAIGDLRAVIGERQLVVSEYGRPAWLGFVRGSQPAAQARRVADLVDVIDRTDVDGSMVWVLRDPDRPIEDGAFASRASVSYGLMRVDGTERPVADVIRSDGRLVPPAPSLPERVRSSPSLMVGLLGGLIVLSGAVHWRRRRLIQT